MGYDQNPNEQALTKATIIVALEALNDRLNDADTSGEICIFGGTAMVLAFNARLSTKDIDAVFKPPQLIREASEEIARELGLQPGWLNDGVKGFLSSNPTYTEEDLPQMSHLRVFRPTAEYLLAMKCMAARAPAYNTKGDREDILFLISRLGLTKAEEVLSIVEKFYSSAQILPKTQFMVHEVIAMLPRATAAPTTDITHLSKPENTSPQREISGENHGSH